MYVAFPLPACDPVALGSVAVPSSLNGPGMVTVINGVVNYNGVTPGSTALLVCNNGYTTGEDSNDRVCMSDGNWSGGTQTCVLPIAPCIAMNQCKFLSTPHF